MATVALLVLWHLNGQYDGFALLTSNHYSWTYGPTAILVLIVAIWRQIDQYCKVLTPWTTLRRENAQADDSVSLDYVSPLQVLSLWSSFKNGHYVVSITVLSFLLLKLITLASTGLFFTDQRVLTASDVAFTTTTDFDGSAFNATSYLGVANPSYFYTAYADMVKGLADIEGTQGHLVYQVISPPPSAVSLNATMTAIVDVFVPSFNCGKAVVSANLQPANSTDQDPEDTLNLHSPACELLAGALPIYALNPALYECPKRQLSGLMQRVDCSGRNSTTLSGNWQLLTMTDMRYEQTVAKAPEDTLDGDFEASTWSTSIANITAIVCRPSYAIVRQSLTYDLSESPPTITVGDINDPRPRSLDGFRDEDLAQLFSSAYVDAALMFGNKADQPTAEEYPDTLFQTMAQVSGGNYEALLDQDIMIRAAEKVFGHVAAQIAAEVLVQSRTRSVAGEMSFPEERLYMRPFAVWMLAGGFSILIILSLFVFFGRPIKIVSRDPDHVTSMAWLLSRSPAFENLLMSCLSHGQPSLDRMLQEYEYSGALNADGILVSRVVVQAQPIDATTKRSTESTNDWWRPLFLQLPMVILSLVLPCILIAILEVLHRLSSRAGGIAILAGSGSLSTALSTRFMPALTLLLVATSFNALDFNIAVLAPYHALKTRSKGTKSSNCGPLLGKIPVAALWTALRNRYNSAFLSGLAALLGSLLTIVGSGLLTVEEVAMSAAAGSSFRMLDSFDQTWTNSVLNDNGAAVVSSLIEAANLSYPPNTYEDVAFPRLQLSDGYSGSVANTTLLNTNIPALRASLRCESLNSTQYNVTASFNSHILSSSIFVQAAYSLPPHCLLGGPGGNLSTLKFEYSFQLPSSTNASFMAKMLDLHVGPFSGPFADSSDEISPYTQPDNPVGCPSLGFIYGFANVNNIGRNTIATMVCYQVLEELQVNTTLATRDLTVPTSNPPIVGPDPFDDPLLTSTEARNITKNALSYRIQVHTDQSLSLFNQTQYSSSSIVGPAIVDNFFQAVFFGRTPLPQDAMRDSSAMSRQSVRTAIQAFYRRYMAQAISANMRVSLAPSTAAASASPNDLRATVLNIRTPVLRQNELSKIILQVLLGIMFLCGLTAVLLNPIKNVVPYNPCTIAGSAALLAGSRLVREAAKEYETLSVKDSEDLRLRLGWWESDDDVVADGDSGQEACGRRYGIDELNKIG
ncbi:hypothetical protein A1O7_09153 [Cladophialophora yegresii CBS 114405]|uniref:Uncharacterized protein n=1 Tax=Cladophialophora yegresii CBS 114405 TaxID=1182544 RepID=W9VDX3_9EURO|nr:uncharacterized protein A1O7_09153 [Cladophialophora yegresii CBS 114405]EXJ53817.1 hypothetical protein A1O7_09153 [Cladophialophora yegresii CBS 114405]